MRRAELFRVEHYLVPEGLGIEDFVDQSDFLRPVEREQLSLDHQLNGEWLAGDTGEPLRAARARKHTKIHLRQADLAAVLFGQADVARHGDLEPPTHRLPIERGNWELRRLLEAVDRFVGVETEEVFEAGRDRVEHADVRAGGEELVAAAANDDDVHVVVEPRLENR